MTSTHHSRNTEFCVATRLRTQRHKKYGRVISRNQTFVVQRLRIKTNKYVNTVSSEQAAPCLLPTYKLLFEENKWFRVTDSLWVSGRMTDRPTGGYCRRVNKQASKWQNWHICSQFRSLKKSTPQLCRTSLISCVADTARLLSRADLLGTKSVSPVTDRSGSHAYVTSCHKHRQRPRWNLVGAPHTFFFAGTSSYYYDLSKRREPLTPRHSITSQKFFFRWDIPAVLSISNRSL